MIFLVCEKWFYLVEVPFKKKKHDKSKFSRVFYSFLYEEWKMSGDDRTLLLFNSDGEYAVLRVALRAVLEVRGFGGDFAL